MDDLTQGPIPLEDIPRTMRSLVEAAAAARVFADPVTQGDRVVVPAAAIRASLGFGFGGGSGRGPSGAGEGGAGGGGGGGGTSVARPVAAVEIGPDGVRIHPIVDRTRLTLIALAAGSIVALALLRGRRGHTKESARLDPLRGLLALMI